jgi:hypothetical protein
MAKSKCFSLIAFFFLSAALRAQFETSEVLGTGRDNTGGVRKATVTLLQQETGSNRKPLQTKTATTTSSMLLFA